MPAKPTWYSKIGNVIEALQRHPHPYVDRATVEFLLGVGRRRAQQILAPCIATRVGANGLGDRDALIRRLDQIARGDDASWEVARRRRVAGAIGRLRQDRMENPRVIVEASTAVVNREVADLPEGVRLEPGRITVDFDEPHQALEKLLALAMAIGNDFERFERSTRRS